MYHTYVTDLDFRCYESDCVFTMAYEKKDDVIKIGQRVHFISSNYYAFYERRYFTFIIKKYINF